MNLIIFQEEGKCYGYLRSFEIGFFFFSLGGAPVPGGQGGSRLLSPDAQFTINTQLPWRPARSQGGRGLPIFSKERWFYS